MRSGEEDGEKTRPQPNASVAERRWRLSSPPPRASEATVGEEPDEERHRRGVERDAEAYVVAVVLEEAGELEAGGVVVGPLPDHERAGDEEPDADGARGGAGACPEVPAPSHAADDTAATGRQRPGRAALASGASASATPFG